MSINVEFARWDMVTTGGNYNVRVFLNVGCYISSPVHGLYKMDFI